MASFFACHRPMSVTNSVPVPQAHETFSSIFTEDFNSKPQPAQVISVLDNAIQSLERGKSRQQSRVVSQDQQVRVRAQRRDLNDLLSSTTEQSSNENGGTHHLDGSPRRQNVGEPQYSTTIEQFAKQFRPFRIPPAPEPISNLNFAIVDGGTPHENQLSPHEEHPLQRVLPEHQAPGKSEEATVYRAYLTVKEHVLRNGEKYFTAHASPLVKIRKRSRKGKTRAKTSIGNVSNPLPTTFQDSGRTSTPYMQRKRRNVQIIAELKERNLHALSVKRQRKLKMKKHKHKKLMRKTRNLRRKLDKL
ncbi:MAG: hypothetical protein Q9160_007557 [Pyrenula sp. 1 TL-2023]